MIAAVFDLDGTLYTGHISRGITLHNRTQKTNRLPLYFYMFTHMPLWWLSKLRLMSAETARELWARNMGWAFRGWTKGQAVEASAWIAEEYVKPLVRPDIMEYVYKHQRSGDRVILVSGTPAPLLAEIGHQLGIEETIGTPLSLQDGRYTGLCELPVCQAEGKVVRLLEHLKGESVNWSESFVYADSHTDQSLLEQVGHPMAVYPDDELAEHAEAMGWEIIGR